jgi:hypothetical protein
VSRLDFTLIAIVGALAGWTAVRLLVHLGFV